MAKKPAVLLSEFNALTERRANGALRPEEEQQLELLRDVLLELGSLPTAGETNQPRSVRADASLEVSFSTGEEVVRAYSKNIGTGGIAIRTQRVLPNGSLVELHLKLPNMDKPCLVRGTVAWGTAESMGVAFTELPPVVEQQLKEFLVRDESVLKRIRSVLMRDVRRLGTRPSPPPPEAAAAVEIDTRPAVLVFLSDPQFMLVVREVLEQGGVRVAASGSDVAPAVVVVDARTAVDTVATHPLAPVVLVNVSGPDALFGELARLRPAAFLKRPAAAALILETVVGLLPPARP